MSGLSMPRELSTSWTSGASCIRTSSSSRAGKPYAHIARRTHCHTGARMTAVTALPDAAPRKSFRDVWLITLGHSLTHWYPATFYLLLPIIGKELGLSYSQIGLIMTCQYIAGAVANIPGGVLVDTVGRKGVLMATSLFWVGVPYLLMGFT